MNLTQITKFGWYFPWYLIIANTKSLKSLKPSELRWDLTSKWVVTCWLKKCQKPRSLIGKNKLHSTTFFTLTKAQISQWRKLSKNCWNLPCQVQIIFIKWHIKYSINHIRCGSYIQYHFKCKIYKLSTLTQTEVLQFNNVCHFLWYTTRKTIASYTHSS